jgi:hypothetical protein
LSKREPKKSEIFLEYQPYADLAINPGALYDQAKQNDQVTVNYWKETWVNQTRMNKARVGSFADHSIGKLFGKHRFQPCIVVGSGPSLKDNAHLLKNNPGIPVISCLHNFHYLEDLGVPADYYVTLDSGPITIEEVSEGGEPGKDYWEITKDRKLIAFIGTHPDLIRQWQGEIYFYNAVIPDEDCVKRIDEIENFRVYCSNGGNVLGACVYVAKGFLGCSTVAFLGSDFSFSYTNSFHAWTSKYDANLGHVVYMTDVYGNRRKSWQSYANFKAWFDWLVTTIPGQWINCSEGGCMGSYPQGNIRELKQMDLMDFFSMINMHEDLREQAENPQVEYRKILY